MKMSATKAVLALCFIFYFMNEASSLKCYQCSSLANDECGTNPAQSKYIVDCSESESIDTDSTYRDLKGSSSLSALAHISALIGRESSTMSIFDLECLTLTGSIKQVPGVVRACIPKVLPDAAVKLIAAAHGMRGVLIRRCDTDLCNSSAA